MNSHNVGGDKTSVRVHQTPGGNSSLCLGWEQKCEAVKNRKVDRNQSSIVFGDGLVAEPLVEKKSNYPMPIVEPTKKVVQQVGGNTTINLGEDFGPVKTSVKVRAPPGGKSNIIFG